MGSLLEDGRPVESGAKYRKANELQQKGGSIEIIDEDAFLRMLGEAPTAPAAAAAAAAAAAVAVAPAPATAVTKATAADGDASSLWAEKYRPRTPDEFVGNAEPFRLLLEWLRDWNDVCLRGRP